MLDPQSWWNEGEVFDFWPKDGYINCIAWKTFEGTSNGALKTMTSSFLYNPFLAKVKHLCFKSPELGFLTPLERSLNIINCQKWGSTPYQNMSLWEALRINLFCFEVDNTANSHLLFQMLMTARLAQFDHTSIVISQSCLTHDPWILCVPWQLLQNCWTIPLTRCLLLLLPSVDMISFLGWSAQCKLKMHIMRCSHNFNGCVHLIGRLSNDIETFTPRLCADSKWSNICTGGQNPKPQGWHPCSTCSR